MEKREAIARRKISKKKDPEVTEIVELASNQGIYTTKRSKRKNNRMSIE